VETWVGSAKAIARSKFFVSASAKKIANLIGKETHSTGELRQIESTASIDFDQNRSVLRNGYIHRLISHGLKNGRTGTGHLHNAIPHWNDFANQGLVCIRMYHVVRRSQLILRPGGQNFTALKIQVASEIAGPPKAVGHVIARWQFQDGEGNLDSVFAV
jgi:hypothetical protein